jgi:AcrR family transcriptional regulator
MARPADPTARISLLRASESVFSEHGLGAAKVEEITRRAGLSKGAFYLHFDSKEEAFRDVVEAFLARMASLLPSPNEAVEIPTSPERMLAFWLERDEEMFEFLWQNRQIVGILDSCQGPYTYLVDSFRENMQGTSRGWIEHCKASGFVREELDTELVVDMLWGAYHELAHRMLGAEKKPPIGVWLRQAQQIVMGGLATPALRSALRASAPARNLNSRPKKRS